MNDTYSNQSVEVQAEKEKLFREAKEKASLWAYSQFGPGWDRKDVHEIATFYNLMIQYLINTYVLKQKP